ncbi:hypothetical protein DICVIV_11892 [Dictyocaulus viviparus]|uniref:tRNA-binding domain-containing protein n=1 Tax=Dictyocaulus viviparus TaxID=29172 RepID=A0A0D8XBY6_DICVI|nr:hypothetical protein DICVIV_11892 [Dictyocaulus viviparus]
MLHENVIRTSKLKHYKLNGLAGGIGVERIARSGTKVEILQTEYLVIGQVVEIKQHTYSPDKLVCTIKIKADDKGDEKITTVCKKEMLIDKKIIKKYVIVALNGCEIDGKTVVEKDMKGIISQGIICTYNQLARSKYPNKLFEKEHDEIVILDYGNIGDSHTDKYIAMDDCLFDITLSHNRDELHGVKYIARELSTNLKLKFTGHEEPHK